MSIKQPIQGWIVRDDWMRAVLAADLQQTTKLVACRLALHLNIETGQCTPSYAKLGARVGLKRRATIDAVSELVKSGWLDVEKRGQGAGQISNNFVLLAVNLKSEDADESGARPYTGGVHGGALGSAPTCTRVVHDGALGWCTAVHPNNEFNSEDNNEGESIYPSDGKNSSSEVQEPISHPPRKLSKTVVVDENLFGAFWSAYPRRVAEVAARKAFAAAVKQGADPLEIAAGARRYAVDCRDREPRFIANPVNWLTGKRWRDDLAVTSGPTVIDQAGNVVAMPTARADKRPRTFLEMELARSGQ